jgi:hypothetical protein
MESGKAGIHEFVPQPPPMPIALMFFRGVRHMKGVISQICNHLSDIGFQIMILARPEGEDNTWSYISDR